MGATLDTGAFSNAEAIYKGLLAMGLSTDAAAGVAGNIYQESHGDPGIGSSAGGGLFGEEVQNGGSVSGGSLAEQLSALKSYIAANGSISAINANASSPSAAAAYFMSNYERPNAAFADESTREDAAEWVAAAAKSGNWGTSAGTAGSGSSPSGGGSGGSILSIPSEITGFFDDIDTAIKYMAAPTTWVRLVAFVAGAALLTMAVYALIVAAEGGSGGMQMPNIVPVPI
jgi:Phage tail lysozyme